MTQHTVVRDPFNPRVALVETELGSAVIIAPPNVDPTDITGWVRPADTNPRSIGY